MKEVRTELMIAAAPEKIWKVLADGPDWSAWNPFVTEVLGVLRAGAKLRVTVHMPGFGAMRFKPTVLAAEPARELRWLGRLLVPGIFDGEHYFLLEAGPGGTRLIHGERFSGLLSGLADLRKLEPGFHALNQGLKRTAEAA